MERTLHEIFASAKKLLPEQFSRIPADTESRTIRLQISLG
jgi:hypothetical protein